MTEQWDDIINAYSFDQLIKELLVGRKMSFKLMRIVIAVIDTHYPRTITLHITPARLARLKTEVDTRLMEELL